LSYDATDARRATVALTGPHRTILFGIDFHRAKLHQREGTAVLADSLLFVKDWPSRFEPDQNRRHDDDRQRENCGDQCHQPMHRVAQQLRDFCLTTATSEDEP